MHLNKNGFTPASRMVLMVVAIIAGTVALVRILVRGRIW